MEDFLSFNPLFDKAGDLVVNCSGKRQVTCNSTDDSPLILRSVMGPKGPT